MINNSTMKGEKEPEQEESWISFMTKLRTKTAEQQHTNKRKPKNNLQQADRDNTKKAKNI